MDLQRCAMTRKRRCSTLSIWSLQILMLVYCIRSWPQRGGGGGAWLPHGDPSPTPLVVFAFTESNNQFSGFADVDSKSVKNNSLVVLHNNIWDQIHRWDFSFEFLVLVLFCFITNLLRFQTSDDWFMSWLKYPHH